MNRVSYGSRNHSYLEGSLLINTACLLCNSKIFTKEFFWKFPLGSSVWARTQPTEGWETGQAIFFLWQRPYIIRNLSVPKIPLEMFILLYRKAFLGDKWSCNLKLGWMCVLHFFGYYQHTWHSENRSAPKPKHLSFWNIFLDSKPNQR